MPDTKYTQNRVADFVKKRAEDVAANRDKFIQELPALKQSAVDLGDKALSKGIEYTGKTDKFLTNEIVPQTQNFKEKIARLLASKQARQGLIEGGEDIAEAGGKRIPGLNMLLGAAAAVKSGDLLAATPVGESTDSGGEKGSPTDLFERGKITPDQFEQTLRDNSRQPASMNYKEGGVLKKYPGYEDGGMPSALEMLKNKYRDAEQSKIIDREGMLNKLKESRQDMEENPNQEEAMAIRREMLMKLLNGR